jgi:peptidoglycan hydrolase-like protein with peptidoglycan-binding domain
VPGTEAKSNPSKDVRGVLCAGTRLLGYEIVSLLGQGGFGVTYLARDVSLDCRVAIKEYLPTSIALREGGTSIVPRSADLSERFEWGRERFLAEARALAKLGDAPAIVGIHDLLEANGTAYLVMELAGGEQLHRRLLHDKSLSPPVIERMLSSLLEGLQAVHTAGLLHHDIKPANIIVDSRGNPTLVDFGAARAAMAGRAAGSPAASTSGYAAAEQFNSAKQGPWTDIYGLSATLYHAISGKPPPSIFDRMLDDACEPLARLMPKGFAPALLVGIDAGLRVRASERPQSIADWRSILPPFGPLDEAEAFVMRGPLAARAAVAAFSSRPKRGMGFWVGLSAAVVVAALVSDGALKLMASSSETADATHRPAVTESAALKQAEARTLAEEAGRKAAEEKLAAETAARRHEEEARLARQQEQAAAIESSRQIAEAEGRAAAQEALQREAAAEVSRQASAAKAPESGPNTEAALNLSEQERKRVQAALTALGHEVPVTGYFGPITRSMITAWQRTQGLPETGFLDVPQLAALYAQPVPTGDVAERIKLDAQRTEAALNLSDQERKRVQVTLTALGHEVPTTGYFGPITRRMITAWQKTQGLPATGYLTDPQLAALEQQAAGGSAKYEQARRQ